MNLPPLLPTAFFFFYLYNYQTVLFVFVTGRTRKRTTGEGRDCPSPGYQLHGSFAHHTQINYVIFARTS